MTKQLNLILNGSGGVGKRFFAVNFLQALTDRRLWQLEGAWFCLGLVYMTVTVHSVPFARDLGLPLDRASLLLTGYGVGATVGRLVSSAVADRFALSRGLAPRPETGEPVRSR